jgi:toxoflavin biosynthesis protein ToxC
MPEPGPSFRLAPAGFLIVGKSNMTKPGIRHWGPIAGLATSGAYVATAGYDNQLILWEAVSKSPIARSLHDHLVNQCAFNPAGTLIATASSDYSARIWDVPSLRLRAALIGHEDDVDMAVFSPDGLRIATCALDRTIRIWDLSGVCLNILRGHTGNILSVAWTNDGARLVSSGVDGTIRIWSAVSGAEIARTDMNVRTDAIAIISDGRILAGDDLGRIALIANGDAIFTEAHRAGIKNIAFDETSGTLVTISYDRTLAVWSVGTANEVHEIARAWLPAQVWARASVLLRHGLVALGTFGSSYAVFDWTTNHWDLEGVEPDISLNAIAIVDGTRYAIGDAGILFRDGQPAAILGSLCNFLLPAGGRLLTGGQMGCIYDAKTGEVLYQHNSPLNCAAYFWREGGPHVVVGSYTGEALIFALDKNDTPRLLRVLKIFENAIKGLVATAERIFSVCASTDIAWHDTADFRLIRLVPKAHEKIANGCSLAGPNGFASIGRDRKLRIWTGNQEDVYQTPHPNSVKCICASDDRATLMTGAYTGTLAGFDMVSRQWTSFIRPTASGISNLAYDGGNRRFLASSYDGQIYAAA